jgi:hypothetical protein
MVCEIGTNISICADILDALFPVVAVGVGRTLAWRTASALEASITCQAVRIVA